MIRTTLAGLVCVLAAVSIAAATTAVNLDVSTPNARVQIGNMPAPPPPQVMVVERERVVVKEHGHRDNGKHKGHHKKHKKEKKHHD